MEKQLPKNWVECTLGELATVQSGGTPSRGINSYWNGDIPWVKISDIKEMYVDKTTEFITEEGLKNSSTRIFPKGTILFTIFATLGKIGILNIDAATNQAIAGITPSKAIDDKYLTYALIDLSNSISEYGKGVAQKNINQAILKDTIIPLPPLTEQNRIVEKLDRLFAQMETIKTSMANIPLLLKDFRQQVLTQAVTGKLTEEWRKGKELDSLQLLKSELETRKIFWLEQEKDSCFAKNKKFEEEKVLKKYKEPLQPNNLNISIPNEWSPVCWDQLSNWITYGFTKPMPTVEIGIPKITVKHIRNNKIDFATSEFTTDEAFESLNEKDKPKKGDILITKDGATIGRSAVVEENVTFCIGQSVAVVWLRSTNCNPKFLNYIINSKFIQDRIWEVARGMGMPHLSITDFRAISFGLPTLQEQKEIVRRVASLFAKADAIEQQYKNLKAKINTLPQVILHKAFKGELSEQLASDGDARELLQQIQELKNSTVKPKKATSKKVKKYPENETVLGMVAEE